MRHKENPSAEELIAEVDSADRETARLAIARGVREAEAQWVGAHLIAEALAIELAQMAKGPADRNRIASYLRDLADELEADLNVH